MSAPNAQKRRVVRGPGRGPGSGVRANLALGSRGPGHFGAGVLGSESPGGGALAAGVRGDRRVGQGHGAVLQALHQRSDTDAWQGGGALALERDGFWSLLPSPFGGS